ncbi:MAG: hypothetical protein MUO34_06195 [Ignavibacteriaceae bacterium]|nr:hypothetical protein [Ignavibacteriaceae bacterium]
MKRKFIIPLSVLLGIFMFLNMGFKGKEEGDDKNTIKKINTNDVFRFIAANQILMWASNNGDGSHDPRTDANGFYWPGGLNATKSAVFEDGLIFGAMIGREIRVNGNTHRQGLQAGKILESGEPADPTDPRYRIYKIKKGWENLPPGPDKEALQKDYEDWPIEDGAPYEDIDGDGKPTPGVDLPKFLGDEVLWYVANDMDPNRSTFTYGTLPMGLEFQTTIFAFNRTGDLGDMIFKKYVIINKGQNLLRDMIVGYWSDTDLGDAEDDFTGCDTSLSLGYTWNGDNDDGGGSGAAYGTPPPAMGYDFFQGPIVEAGPTDSAKFLGSYRKGYRNLGMTAFVLYINTNLYPWVDPDQGVPSGSIQFYNYLQGMVWDGSPFIDPHTLDTTVFVLTGDPETGTGWYEGDGWPGGPAPGDRRHVMASGKFDFAPQDTQEVVVGLLIARGLNNLNSVTELKRKDLAAQIAYDLDFNITDPPPTPKLSAYAGNKLVSLWWETNSESYDAGDPLIYGQGYDDTTYTFQGYRIWQYRDLSGTDPRLIGIYDLEDTLKVIYDYATINGISTLVPVMVLENKGLLRSFKVTSNAYTNADLYNGNPYYFGVTAFGYSHNSAGKVLESPPTIIEVLPGKPAIDLEYEFDVNSNVYLNQVSGNSDAIVRFKVIDPDKLTGNTYAIEFYGPDDSLKYRVIDKTLQDTLLTDRTEFITFEKDDVTKEYFVPRLDTLKNPIMDGFMILIQNIGSDSITSSLATKYKVKGVYEVNGPGGQEIDNPANLLYGNFNSTGAYTIKAGKSGASAKGDLVWQTLPNDQTLGYKDYELRFTDSSGFYASGYIAGWSNLITKPDSLGIGKVPFAIWDIGRTPESIAEKLVVKVWDNDNLNPTLAFPDKKWSQLPDGSWEQIFAFNSVFSADSLPITSGSSTPKQYPFGAFVIDGSLPETGTVLRVEAFKPLTDSDVFEGVPTASIVKTELAKSRIDNISVFPNPYFGASALERDQYQRFVRFTNLPQETIIRIFSLSGVLIQRIDKNDTNQYVDWDLRNEDGLPVASGIFIAYLEMPGIGTKIMKIAVIMEQQYIDRM